MAGYLDTRQLIINTLTNRPAGTEIQPEDHQAFALQITDYIRAVELVAGNATPIGFAEASTVPVEPENGQAVYLSQVNRGTSVTFTYFLDENNQPITVSADTNTVKFVTLLWNGSYWSVQTTSVSATVLTAETLRVTITESGGSYSSSDSSSVIKTAFDAGKYVYAVLGTELLPLIECASSSSAIFQGETKRIEVASSAVTVISANNYYLNVNILRSSGGQPHAAYTSVNVARADVPLAYRKVGLEITYLFEDSTTHETKWLKDQYIGSDISGWGTTSNWQVIGPVSISQNTETGHTDIKVGNTTIPVASVEDVSRLDQELHEDINERGEYFSTEDYVYSITDSYGRILFAIKKSGGIVWGKLSDEAKQKIVEEFITNVPGDSEELAASQKMVTEQLDALREYLDHESYVYLITDKEGRIIEAVDMAGVKHIFAKVEYLQINRYIDIDGHRFDTQDSGDYLQVVTDTDGKVVEGIRLDGTKEVNVDVRHRNMDMITGPNDDYLFAITDKDKKFVLGLAKNGTVVMPKLKSESVDTIKRIADVWLGRVSIIGDSISTYEGYIIPISGYSDGAFYPHKTRDLTNVNQTWWKMLIDACGDGKLEINASYGGSRATTTSSAPDFYVRTPILGHPDTIFVALGSNDSRNARMGDYDYDSPIEDLPENEFIPAYTKGVRNLLALYPGARIVLVMLAMRDTYKTVVANIGQHYGLQVIDAGAYFTGEWLDAEPWVSGNVHPNKNGMLLIARTIYKNLLKYELS